MDRDSEDRENEKERDGESVEAIKVRGRVCGIMSTVGPLVHYAVPWINTQIRTFKIVFPVQPNDERPA